MQRTRFFGIRCGDTIVVDRDFERAVEAALPAEHELEVDAILIEAFDKPQADEIAGSDGIPWTQVPITEEGEPAVLAWHQQRPTVDELACYDRVVLRQRDVDRRQIAREVRDLEQRRSQELGC